MPVRSLTCVPTWLTVVADHNRRKSFKRLLQRGYHRMERVQLIWGDAIGDPGFEQVDHLGYLPGDGQPRLGQREQVGAPVGLMDPPLEQALALKPVKRVGQGRAAQAERLLHRGDGARSLAAEPREQMRLDLGDVERGNR